MLTISVPCPARTCNAPAGYPCKQNNGSYTKADGTMMHAERVAARVAAESAATAAEEAAAKEGTTAPTTEMHGLPVFKNAGESMAAQQAALAKLRAEMKPAATPQHPQFKPAPATKLASVKPAASSAAKPAATPAAKPAAISAAHVVSPPTPAATSAAAPAATSDKK